MNTDTLTGAAGILRWLRIRRGAAAAEFALTFPILLGLSTVILDYGWFYACAQGARRAAHLGARAGSQVLIEKDPASVGAERAQNLYDAAYPTNLMVGTVSGSLVDNDKVLVTVEMSFEPLVGILPVPSSYRASAEWPLERL